ncbi:hypothetical protein THAOC_18047 [Thalassiosira oceanica]|uniref:Uncharacterized protein n=1 Tax=Thalassiosira oceanica TaxID=159749 RepID=K0SKE0_THAOC|nr:hypothetical protein THAOC_18047 [Thalassiosira oceanica]|eukprot:EJK61461.1 hypothetical protein THAOC_18047 [Thalassiosira oceanica]
MGSVVAAGQEEAQPVHGQCWTYRPRGISRFTKSRLINTHEARLVCTGTGCPTQAAQSMQTDLTINSSILPS